MQTWPALRYAAPTIFGSATSRFASAHSTVKAMLPSSICVRRNPAFCWMSRPTSVLPVKAKKRIAGSSISHCGNRRAAVITEIRPLGRPASISTCASIADSVGVLLDGLTITALPAAMAGATLCVDGVDRCVERRDRAHDAERHGNREADAARPAAARPRAGSSRRSGAALRRPRRETSGGSGAARSAHRSSVNPASVRMPLDEALAVALDDRCGAVEDRAAVVGRQRRLHVRVVRGGHRTGAPAPATECACARTA